MRAEDLQELKDIKEQMLNLLEEADHLIRTGCDADITHDRWHGYVYSHIIMALTEEHYFLGGSMFTMEDIIKELEGCDEEYEEE